MGTNHHYEIVKKTSFQMIGLPLRTTNARAAFEIPDFWSKIYDSQILNSITHKKSDELISLYTDYEGDHTAAYTMIVGYPVDSIDEIPAGMVAKTIPASTYAVFTAKGEMPQSIFNTWQSIWHTDLPRTYTGDFEVYGERFHNNSEVDIFIAINN